LSRSVRGGNKFSGQSVSLLGLLLFIGLAGCGAQMPSCDSLPPAASAAGPGASGGSAQPNAGRQIVYRASLALRVEDFAATERKITALVQESGGHIAAFREDRNAVAQRSGHWTLRIPIPQFHLFLEQAGQLGIAEQRGAHAGDVTKEYVDLEARLKNKQQLESRLLALVAKRMQGRLRYLTDRGALSTIEFSAYERRDDEPQMAPTFAARFHQMFADSTGLMRHLGEPWVLAVVRLAPWLLLLSIVLTPLVWRVRRRSRRLQSPAVTGQIV